MKPYWLLFVATIANAKLPEYPDFTVSRTGPIGSVTQFATRCAETTDINIDWTLTHNVGAIVPASGITSQIFSITDLADGSWVCYVDAIDSNGNYVTSTNRVLFEVNTAVPNTVFNLEVN